MGWVCPSCGGENSFKMEVCRACGHRAHPIYLAGERLATVRDRLQANQFDFLGRPLEERAWNRAGQAIGVWNGILPSVLIIAVVFAVGVLLLSGMLGLFSRLPRWQNAVAAAPQVLQDRGELVWESLLYDWRPEEERVQAAADGLHAFTEGAAARTEELARRVAEKRSAAEEAAETRKLRQRAELYLGRIMDRVKKSGTLVMGGQQGVEYRAETRERAKECIAQYQETFTQRVQEVSEKVWTRLQPLGNG